MQRFLLCLFLLLSAWAWARPPAEVVDQLYTVHLKEDNLRVTTQKAASCFTPGFLGLIERALARTPSSGRYVDADFLTNSQGGWGDFEIGPTTVKGKDATVKVKVWSGLRSHGPDGPLPLSERKAMHQRIKPQQLTVYLTDVGEGFQIKDLEFAAYSAGAEQLPAFRVRPWLKDLSEHK